MRWAPRRAHGGGRARAGLAGRTDGGCAGAAPCRRAARGPAWRPRGPARALAAAYPPHPLDPEQLWQAISAALTEHADRLLGALERHPQTNEVARSGILLPGFLTIARATERSLALLELGASAGLNLL